MTADRLLVFVFCSLLVAFLVFYLLAVRRSIRNRRLREVEGLFDSGIARSRRTPLGPGFGAALTLLEQGEEIVRRGRESISALAPVVPPPVSGGADAGELRSRMVECLEQDYQGWKVGGAEEFLHGLVGGGGEGIPELLGEMVASLKDRMAEGAGEFLEIAKHVFPGTVADPKENAGAVGEGAEGLLEQGDGLLEPQDASGASDAAQVSGSNQGGGIDAGGIDRTGTEIPKTEVPIATVGVSAVSEGKFVERRRTTPGQAFGDASLGVAGTGGGAVSGSRFRSIPIVGPLVGAFLGRRATDLKRRSDRKVRRAYEEAAASAKSAEDESMRKTYERYRQMALEEAAVFESGIGDFPLPSESVAIKEVATSIRRAAQEDYQSECRAVRDARETAATDGADPWYYPVIGLGIASELQRLLTDKMETEIADLDAEYRPLTRMDDLSIPYMKRVSRATAREGGTLERAVERAAIRIDIFLRKELEDFVLWSSEAKVAREQSLKKLIEVVGRESDRHAKEMDGWVSRLHSLKEEVDREAGLGSG